MHHVREQVEKIGDLIAEQGPASDDLGRLTDEAVAAIKGTGVIRMLQPEEFGGFETHPAEFFESVFALGRRYASAGWVTSVVGIHPWELSLADRKVQEEVWGADPDTWVASPYAPMGKARRAEGGWTLTGRWSFSSGTDHCSWVMIGGLLLDEDDKVTGQRHFMLPRSDYEIVAESWEVMGLKGTGSRDLVVKDAFVPDHRIIDPAKVWEGAKELGRDSNPLYRLVLPILFSGTITAGTLAACQGALDASVRYMKDRVNAKGARVAEDPHHLSILGEAAADIEASKLQFLTDINRAYDQVESGKELSIDVRITARRNQVRAVRRSVDAIDRLFVHAGGGALRLDQPFQRFWRDAHAGMNHVNNAAEPVYEGWSKHQFGLPIPEGLKY